MDTEINISLLEVEGLQKILSVYKPFKWTAPHWITPLNREVDVMRIHDLGKIGIPSEILAKSCQLTEMNIGW